MSASDWFHATRDSRFAENPSLALRARIEELLGVSAFLVGAAAFKAVERLFKQSLVGSIPIHSRVIRADRP